MSFIFISFNIVNLYHTNLAAQTVYRAIFNIYLQLFYFDISYTFKTYISLIVKKILFIFKTILSYLTFTQVIF